MAIQKSSKKTTLKKIGLLNKPVQIGLEGLEPLPAPAKPNRTSLKKKGFKDQQNLENEQSTFDAYASAGGEKYASATGTSESSVSTTDVAPVSSAEPGSLDKEDRDDRAGVLLSDGSVNAQDSGIHPAWYGAGLVSVGGGAVALGSAGGGAAAAAATTTAAVAGSSAAASAGALAIGGTIVMGPLVNTHDLVVKAYKADGSLLATGIVNADGTYIINYTGDYTGVVIVKAYDINNLFPDYMDEASGAAKDLGIDLRAVTVVAGSGTYTVNLNALTELAAQSLGLGIGSGGQSSVVLNNVTASTVATANGNVASAFGLTGVDIITTSVIPVVNVQGQNNASANDYGRALAAISGLELSTGQTTDQVLTTLSQSLTGASLSGYGQALLVGGANFVGNQGISSAGGVGSGGSNSFAAQLGNTSSTATQVRTAWQTILASADATDNNAINPTQSQYSLVGVTGVDTAAEESLLGDVLDIQQNPAVDSVPELQALAGLVQAVMNQATGNGSVSIN